MHSIIEEKKRQRLKKELFKALLTITDKDTAEYISGTKEEKMTVKEYNQKFNWKIPTNCEVCGSEILINESGFPYCQNKNCQRKISHRFAKMFEILKIKGCGDAFINNLEANKVSVKDFIDMCINNESDKICFYAKSINGNKILKQMREAIKKPISVAKYLAMFDYEGFDEKKLKLLDFPLEKCYNLSIKEIMEIDGFAEVTAKKFVSFMEEYKMEIEELRDYFTVVHEEKKSGSIVVFTGTGPLSRKELSKIAEDKGYIVGDSITKETSILICEDINGNSSKLVKARKNGIKIISYKDFLDNV